MKKAILFLLTLFNLSLFSQQIQNPIINETAAKPGINISNKTGIYIDKNWEEVPLAKAKYKVTPTFVDKNFIIKGVGTYDGLVLQAEEAGMDIYKIDFKYATSNQLAFSVHALYTNSMPNAYYFNGPAVWYRPDGSLMAKGNMKSGKLHGEYTEYDKNGNITQTVEFSNGSIFNKADFKNANNTRIIGKWHQTEVTENSGFTDYYVLYNAYDENGILTASDEQYTMRNGEKSFFKIENPSTSYYKYVPINDNEGMVEIYVEGKLYEKERIQWINKNEYKSATVYSDNLNSVGNTFHFKRL